MNIIIKNVFKKCQNFKDYILLQEKNSLVTSQDNVFFEFHIKSLELREIYTTENFLEYIFLLKTLNNIWVAKMFFVTFKMKDKKPNKKGKNTIVGRKKFQE